MEGYKFRVCGNGGQHYYSIINDKYLTRFSVPLHPKPQIRRASRYPKLQAVLQPAKVGVMVNNLQRAVVLDRLTIEVETDDSDDAFLLAMAMATASDADYLVTGDRRAGLLQRGHVGRTRIVTPAVFCAEVL